jgi:hypothetical protein
MAREYIQKVTDDLDGSDGASTVRFGLDGVEWTIDLNAKNESDMRTKLGPFLEGARRVRTGGRAVASSAGRTDKERNAAIREWALSEGVELNARGRIANAVQQAFENQDGDALRDAYGLELVAPKSRRGRG